MSALIASSNAAMRSLQVLGLYLCITGAGLLLAPALLLAPLGLTLAHDVWIRLVGILALVLGACDVRAARKAVAALIPGSVGVGCWPVPTSACWYCWVGPRQRCCCSQQWASLPPCGPRWPAAVCRPAPFFSLDSKGPS